MKIIRAIFLTLVSAALALYLICCLVGNSWNPRIAADSIIAASSSKSEQLIKEAGYSDDWTNKLPEGFKDNEGYIYYKNGDVTMEEALTKLGFTEAGRNQRNQWLTPSGNTSKIISVTYSPGGKMIHLRRQRRLPPRHLPRLLQRHPPRRRKLLQRARLLLRERVLRIRLNNMQKNANHFLRGDWHEAF